MIEVSLPNTTHGRTQSISLPEKLSDDISYQLIAACIGIKTHVMDSWKAVDFYNNAIKDQVVAVLHLNC